MREVVQPVDDAHWHQMRSEVVTSTEVAALFDCSPHCTSFELFHRKKNREIAALEPTERIRWGTRLQDSIAAGIAEDSGFKIRRMTEFIRDTGIRLGASFDFEIVSAGLLEVKNVDALQFRDGWIVEGNDIEAPPHIELQIQTQLLLSKKSFGLIGALVGGNRIEALHRKPDEKIHAAIVDRVEEFWDRIKRDDPPVPDYRRDSAMLMRLHGYAEPGKVHDARGDSDFRELAEEYRRLGEEGKEIDAARLALKMRILDRIGDAEKAMFEGGSVSAGIVSGGPVSYVREQYRNFRVNWKKGKP